MFVTYVWHVCLARKYTFYCDHVCWEKTVKYIIHSVARWWMTATSKPCLRHGWAPSKNHRPSRCQLGNYFSCNSSTTEANDLTSTTLTTWSRSTHNIINRIMGTNWENVIKYLENNKDCIIYTWTIPYYLYSIYIYITYIHCVAGCAQYMVLKSNKYVKCSWMLQMPSTM